MNFISLDIETTGLDPEQDQVLHVAMVAHVPGTPIEELDFFEGVIRTQRVSGHPFALAMNAELLRFIAGIAHDEEGGTYRGRAVEAHASLEQLLQHATRWVHAQREGRPTLAGKNVAGFDLKFLPAYFAHLFTHRVLDVGSMAVGAEPDYDSIPSLGSILKRKVTHDALEDARDVCRAFRLLRGVS